MGHAPDRACAIVPFADHGQVLAARIAGAPHAPSPGGDHVAIFTHRAEARARVAAFLASHPVSGAASRCADR